MSNKIGNPAVVGLAHNVIVRKRSMGKGYAAIDNMLFFHPKSRILFGDAKATMQKLIAEIKSL
jgi:NAD(P) transhydrogenase subunit beta